MLLSGTANCIKYIIIKLDYKHNNRIYLGSLFVRFGIIIILTLRVAKPVFTVFFHSLARLISNVHAVGMEPFTASITPNPHHVFVLLLFNKSRHALRTDFLIVFSLCHCHLYIHLNWVSAN